MKKTRKTRLELIMGVIMLISLSVLLYSCSGGGGSNPGVSSSGGSSTLSSSATTGNGQGSGTPALAPLNPKFIEYRERGYALPAQDKDGHGFGLLPSPVDLSHLSRVKPGGVRERALPTTYDLRTLGKVSPVKNQGAAGTCWAFATYGSLESCLLTAESWDFSENNMAKSHGFDRAWDSGGWASMAVAYLLRWSGPVNTADDPYSDTSPTCNPSAPVQKHMRQVLWFPERASIADNDLIKQAVMNYGGVWISYIHDDTQYNAATYAFYNPAAAGEGHAVTVVGWDDNFPGTSFVTTPPGNGAFLMKNSWGTGWGDSGFFWISYYDVNLGTDDYHTPFTYTPDSFNAADPVTKYTVNYQYDPLGFCSTLGYGAETAWYANVYTATEDSELQAVGTYVLQNNSSYEISVYTDITDGPTSGTLQAGCSTTGTIQNAGFNTITLPTAQPLGLTTGQKFSVVIKMTTPGYKFPIPVEEPIGGYSSAATANAGESYTGTDGTTWQDVTTSFPNTNVCIKAYAGPPTAPNAPRNLAVTSVTYSTVNLQWTDRSDTEDGFYVERKELSTPASGRADFVRIAAVGPNVNTFSDTGLNTNSGFVADTSYAYRVCAFTGPTMSIYSNEANATIPRQASYYVTQSAKSGGGSGGGSGCFIATAAFGSPLDHHVSILRHFRDTVLMNNNLGVAFVNFYYATSPPIAKVIAGNETLRTATRFALYPVVFIVASPGLFIKTALSALAIMALMLLVLFHYQKRAAVRA